MISLRQSVNRNTNLLNYLNSDINRNETNRHVEKCVNVWLGKKERNSARHTGVCGSTYYVESYKESPNLKIPLIYSVEIG